MGATMRLDQLKDKFNKVYDVLVEHVGAPETDTRESFVLYAIEWYKSEFWQTREFRFMGNLGMGGKVWLDPDGYRVNFYREDTTPERTLAMRKANAALDKVFIPKELISE